MTPRFLAEKASGGVPRLSRLGKPFMNHLDPIQRSLATASQLCLKVENSSDDGMTVPPLAGASSLCVGMLVHGKPSEAG